MSIDLDGRVFTRGNTIENMILADFDDFLCQTGGERRRDITHS